MDSQLNLNSERVEEVASSDPVSVEEGDSLRDVFQRMREQRRGAVLVCHDEKLVGIFTERDALKVMAGGIDLELPVAQAMTADPQTLADSDTVGDAISRMSHGGYRRMPIVDGEGRPQGFVKVANILHYLVEHFPSLVYNLPPNPHHSTQSREGA